MRCGKIIFPQFEHFERDGLERRILAAFLEAARLLDVLNFGVAIFIFPFLLLLNGMSYACTVIKHHYNYIRKSILFQ